MLLGKQPIFTSLLFEFLEEVFGYLLFHGGFILSSLLLGYPLHDFEFPLFLDAVSHDLLFLRDDTYVSLDFELYFLVVFEGLQFSFSSLLVEFHYELMRL